MQAQRIPFGKYDFPRLLLMRARTYYKDGNEKLRRNQYMEALINFEKNLQIYTLIFSENFPRFQVFQTVSQICSKFTWIP